MKKIVLLVLCIVLFNCDTESIDGLEQNKKLVLKQVAYPVVDATDNCPGRFANFDSQGKIIEVYYECDGITNIYRTYTYGENDLIHYFTGYLDFTYDENDQLIRRSGGNDTGSSYHDFTYNNNIMLVQGYYSGEQNSWYTRYEFGDDSYTKLMSIKTNHINNGEITYRVTYRYNGNNPIEIFVEQKYSDDSTLEAKRLITITYDDKINPYKLGLPKNAYLSSHTMLAYDVQFYNIAFAADNNITSISIKNLVSNTTYTYTNTYTYNNAMYPTEALLHTNGEPFRKEIFEYYE